MSSNLGRPASAFYCRPEYSLWNPEMTSVLTFGGLNYQAGNPVRGEFVRVGRDIADLRALVQAQSADIVMLRAELAKLAPEGTTLPALASTSVIASSISGASGGAAAGGGGAAGGAAGGQQFGANAVGRRL